MNFSCDPGSEVNLNPTFQTEHKEVIDIDCKELRGFHHRLSFLWKFLDVPGSSSTTVRSGYDDALAGHRIINKLSIVDFVTL